MEYSFVVVGNFISKTDLFSFPLNTLSLPHIRTSEKKNTVISNIKRILCLVSERKGKKGQQLIEYELRKLISLFLAREELK